MDPDYDNEASDQPEVSIFHEDSKLPDHDHNLIATDPDQSLSEDQRYPETMRGIWYFMGWSHIPDMETAAAR